MTGFEKIWCVLSPAERKRAVIVFSLTLVGTVLETLGVGAVVPIIALLVQGNLSANPALEVWLARLGHPTQVQLAQWGMVILVGIYFIKTAYLTLLVWQQTGFASMVQANLSQRLFAIYLHQPYGFHLQRHSAELMHTVGSESTMFAGVLTNVMLLITEVLVILSVAALLLWVEPTGAILVVVVLGAASWVFHRMTRSRLTRWGIARRHHDILRSRDIVQALGGVKDVLLLGRQDSFLSQFRHNNEAVARISHRQTALAIFPRYFLEMLGVVGLAIIVLTQLFVGKELRLIVPTLGLFAAAALRLMPSANRILNAGQALRFSRSVVESVVRESALAISERGAWSGEKAMSTSVEVSGVTFFYPNTAAPALKEVSLTVRRGESVGFVGSSGSGKSTLIDVILGLLGPTAGEVLVDGQDIALNLRAWQNQIGYVSQHIYLTDDTLTRNIAFGIPSDQVDMKAVDRAIRAAQLHQFVASLPKGLETVVGERGVRLSGGQRQRIGIARALYHDPPVLVLDEATSALDGMTEKDLMQDVTALRKCKTILIVAHRLSTVEHCDRLYRLENGQVVEEGTPAQMLGASPDTLPIGA